MQANPQRFAWITMLSAFVVFCLLCISTVIFARWLVFESPTQLNVVLKVGRGTVGLSEPDSSDEKAKRSTATVARHSRLTTDNDSQGYLEFADPYSNKLVATVTLRNDSIVTLQNASRPRFSLSDNLYAIRLTGVNGRVDVWVSNDLDRAISIDIEGPLGHVLIGQEGSFLIDSTPTALTTTVRAGSATLISRTNQTQHLAAPSEATLAADTATIQVGSAPLDLLPNSDFGQAEDWPVGWSCGFTPSAQDPNAPAGEYKFTTVEGRPTVHIQRLQPDPGPGRTGCVHFLAGPQGLDITEYNSVRLRVSMMVLHQQLSACGAAGSECPVMLHMRYLDQSGVERNWYHGFFADYTPNVGRTRCDSCWEEHERINKNAWYTYESGNLFDFPEGQRPTSIIELEFYAEGHQYDVLLNEVALLATP